MQKVGTPAHQETRTHGWDVQDAFGHDEAHVEEEVGGGQEGQQHERQAHHGHVARRRGLAAGCVFPGATPPQRHQHCHGQEGQHGIERKGGQVPRVRDGGNEGDGLHGPVEGERVGAQQQPCVERRQEEKGEGAHRRGVAVRRWVICRGELRRL